MYPPFDRVDRCPGPGGIQVGGYHIPEGTQIIVGIKFMAPAQLVYSYMAFGTRNYVADAGFSFRCALVQCVKCQNTLLNLTFLIQTDLTPQTKSESSVNIVADYGSWQRNLLITARFEHSMKAHGDSDAVMITLVH